MRTLSLFDQDSFSRPIEEIIWDLKDGGILISGIANIDEVLTQQLSSSTS